MFALSDRHGTILSRHERFEEGLGAFARAVRDGAPADLLTLLFLGGAPRESAGEPDPR
jgi:hypothetical protein